MQLNLSLVICFLFLNLWVLFSIPITFVRLIMSKMNFSFDFVLWNCIFFTANIQKSRLGNRIGASGFTILLTYTKMLWRWSSFHFSSMTPNCKCLLTTTNCWYLSHCFAGLFFSFLVRFSFPVCCIRGCHLWLYPIGLNLQHSSHYAPGRNAPDVSFAKSINILKDKKISLINGKIG